MSKKITPAFTIHTESSNRAGSEMTGAMYVTLTRRRAIEVRSLADASLEVRRFIDMNGFGSSDFFGGEVYDFATNKLIAKISYNGRIWDTNGCEITSRSEPA